MVINVVVAIVRLIVCAIDVVVVGIIVLVVDTVVGFHSQITSRLSSQLGRD